MDFDLLSEEEVIEVFRYENLLLAGQLPANWKKLLRLIDLNREVSLILVDLYIATNLFNNNFNIPTSYFAYEMMNIPEDVYNEIKDYFGLEEWNPINVERLQRIFKFYRLLDTKNNLKTDFVIDLQSYMAKKLFDEGNTEIPESLANLTYEHHGYLLAVVEELLSFIQIPLTEDRKNYRHFAFAVLMKLKEYLEKKSQPLAEIVPIYFQSPNKDGDFRWMIERYWNDPDAPIQFSKGLYLFNDNEEQFLEFQNNKKEPTELACRAGSGNSIIRPYQCLKKPISAGIPTGKNGKGYKNLAEAKPAIDKAFDWIHELLLTGDYKAIIFSSDESRKTLGTANYVLIPEVKNYIIAKINEVVAYN